MMLTPGEYGQWYYLIYLLPGGLAMLLLLLSAVSGGGRHHRISAGHRTGGHHGRLFGGYRHGGPKPHLASKHQGPKVSATKEDTSSGPVQQTLSFFGVGRVPGPFVWGSFLLGWGLFGFWGTRLWEGTLHLPILFALPSFVTALVGGLGIAKMTAEVGARLLPQTESYAVSTVELCGQMGTVAFPVDEARGRVNIYDTFGTLHTPAARVEAGRPGIARGRRVLVTDYDAVRDMVIVEEIPF